MNNKFNIGDRVKSTKMGPDMVGVIYGIMEVRGYLERWGIESHRQKDAVLKAFSDTDEKYEEKPIYYLLLDKLNRQITFEEYKTFEPNATLKEYELKINPRYNVASIEACLEKIS